MRTVTLNGNGQSLQARTVAAMIEELALPAPLLLVEVNGLALQRGEWEHTPVQDGDRIEVLRVSAGG
jgi:sulfur carrier protein